MQKPTNHQRFWKLQHYSTKNTNRFICTADCRSTVVWGWLTDSTASSFGPLAWLAYSTEWPKPPDLLLCVLASSVCWLVSSLACLPTPDPYAELLIDHRERGVEGESDRAPEGGEITLRSSSCTWREEWRQTADSQRGWGVERERRREGDRLKK